MSNIQGADAATEVRKLHDWSRKDGVEERIEYVGPISAIEDKVEELKETSNASEINAEYAGYGRATVVYAGNENDDDESDSNESWTVQGIDHTMPINAVKGAFDQALAAEDPEILNDAFQLFARRQPKNAGINVNKEKILQLLQKGVSEWTVSRVVLTKIKVWNSGASISLDWSTVNRAVLFSAIRAKDIPFYIENTIDNLLGWDGTKKQWRVASPSVKTLANGKVETTESWEWAPEWSAALYGGDGTP
jgi:hypothetical protein